MNKKTIFALLPILIGIWGSSELAAAPKTPKIAYVNTGALYDDSAVTARVSKAYDREKQDIIFSRESVKREISDHLADLKAEREYLRREDYQTRVLEVQKRVDELQEVVALVNKQLAALEQEVKLEIFLDISEAIEAVAREAGYDIVLNRKTAVLYGDDTWDITDDVLEALTQINQRDHPNAK